MIIWQVFKNLGLALTYAKEDIHAHGEVIVKADTLLGKAVSDEDGKAVFESDLPFGSYYIKELAAPAGYVSSFETLEVTAKYQGQDLKSAVMTAEWENQLLMMEKGQITDTQFMGEITSLVRKILEVCREIPEEERRRFQTEREVIGKCPVCGCDVFEGKQNFYCSNRQCDFALWKENRFLGSMEKNLDKKMARELLDKACTHVKGLYSKKKDMKFDADLLLTLEDGKPRFHLEFPKKQKK